MEITGRAGEVRTSVGGEETFRQGRYAEMLVTELFGRYFYSALNNRFFHTFVRAVTITATHNTPIAAATATPVVGIHNPIGSNKAAVITRIAFHSTSGTPAGGQVVVNALQTTTAPTTPGGNIFSGNLGAAASPQGSVMRPFNNVALTGMLPVVGNEITLVGGGQSAIALGVATGVPGEDLGGQLIVPPGYLVAVMAGTGAGTTWIVNASMSWQEVDWPL
jgi:hypothetical protein